MKKTFFTGTPPVWLAEKCATFAENLSEVDGNDFRFEITDIISLLKVRSGAGVSTPTELLQFVIEYGNDAFPDLRVALQLLLTICTSVASCERSFSKLKLVLTRDLPRKKHGKESRLHQRLERKRFKSCISNKRHFNTMYVKLL